MNQNQKHFLLELSKCRDSDAWDTVFIFWIDSQLKCFPNIEAGKQRRSRKMGTVDTLN